MKTSALTSHEAFCLANADHFVACRDRGPAGRTRETFPTMTEAEAFAVGFGDRRTMVYAVTAEGRSAHIKNA